MRNYHRNARLPAVVFGFVADDAVVADDAGQASGWKRRRRFHPAVGPSAGAQHPQQRSGAGARTGARRSHLPAHGLLSAVAPAASTSAAAQSDEQSNQSNANVSPSDAADTASSTTAAAAATPSSSSSSPTTAAAATSSTTATITTSSSSAAASAAAVRSRNISRRFAHSSHFIGAPVLVDCDRRAAVEEAARRPAARHGHVSESGRRSAAHQRRRISGRAWSGRPGSAATVRRLASAHFFVGLFVCCCRRRLCFVAEWRRTVIRRRAQNGAENGTGPRHG